MQQYKRKLISLIYTPTMTNGSTHVPKRGKPPARNPSPTHPYLKEETHASPEKKYGPHHHFSFACPWIKGKKISHLNGK